ncbi:DUF2269 family protein [Arthrobacter monumenti]
MEILFSILHVVTAVFLIGPMAILPMTAMRALRAKSGGQVASLAKSTSTFSLLSLIVVFFGFAIMGMSGGALSITTPWILISILVYGIALMLNLFVVVPTMRRAAEELPIGYGGLPAGGEKPMGYGRIAATSGMSAVLLAVVVVLMVWKP